MRKTFLTSLLMLLFWLSMPVAYAQTPQNWQWAKRGGSPGNWPGNNDPEQIMEMTCDRVGNTYVIGRTNKFNANVDGNNLGTLFGDGCMVVASFDCNGAYRWAKPIGAIVSLREPKIGIDTLGGVYISGMFSSVSPNNTGLFSIGTDTTFGSTWKSVVLIKLDTGGRYQWARLPQPDTLAAYSYFTRTIDIDVEPNGTVHMFNMLAPGAYVGGAAVVTTQDLYIFRYNQQGQFLSNLKPQLSSIGRFGGTTMGMAYDTRHSRYYFSGVEDSANKISFNGTPNRNAFYIASYTATGNLQWVKQNVLAYTQISKPSYDSTGNLYLSGTTYPGDTFQAHVFTSPLTTIPYGFPFLMKLGTNGNLLWAKSGQVLNAALGSYGSSYVNGVVAVVGAYSGYLAFDSFKVDVPMNNSSDCYLARFNATTGAVIGLDTAKSAFGYADGISHVCNDAKGNFYVGGSMEATLNFGPHSVTNIGGSSDWFVAKFGIANCNCDVLPSATFTRTRSGRTVTVRYTGPVQGLDSLVWTWGDGQRQVITTSFVNTVSYAYPTSVSGNPQICLIAYNTCGQDTQCVHSTLAVENIEDGEIPLTLAPNPATHTVSIGYTVLSSATIDVYDVLGRKTASQTVTAGTNTWKIDVTAYVPGVYQVVLRSQEGKVLLHQALSVQH